MARRRHSLTLETKWDIYERESGCCFYCERKVYLRGWEWKRSVQDDDATMDHIVPHSEGGNNQKDNIVLSCRICNESRGNKSAFEFIKEIYNVRMD